MAAILIFECRSMSSNLGSAISKSGVVENMVVVTEVSFVVVIHVHVSCIYADFKVFPVFPAAILDFWNVSNMV